MQKLNRNFQLFVETNETFIENDVEKKGFLTITNPFTIKFSIVRSMDSKANTIDIQIYNLSSNSRNVIFQDRYLMTPQSYKKVVLQAGYGTLYTIFAGEMWWSNTSRTGADLITKIHAFDGGFDIGGTFSYKTFEGITQKEDVIKTLINDFYHIDLGAIGASGSGNYPRGVIVDGNTFFLIRKYTDNNCFVDLGKLYVLNNDEVIEGYIPVFNENSGLLNAPKRQNSFLEIDIIFSPEVAVGQLVKLDSKIMPQFNGQFKVAGIKHNGIISDAIGGSCTTTLQLYTGAQVFGGFNKVQPIENTGI